MRRHLIWGWALLAGATMIIAWPRADWTLLRARLLNEQAVERLGYAWYFFFDVINTGQRLWRRAQLDEIDPAPYRDYLQSLARHRGEVVPGAAATTGRRKHVIYIQLESMDGLVIGGRRGGRPVMPFLETLARQNVYFTNALDNTASGRTTDGEFLVLTSQVPLPRPPVYVSQHLDKIPSLPRALHDAGYRTVSLHGFNGAFWHRAEAHAALGYDEMRFEDDLALDDRIGWGWSDKAVLGEAARMVTEAEGSLFLHVITLTNHHPYHYIAQAQNRPVGRIESEYLRSVRYVDEALRDFFARLEAAGVRDDCLVAIYGDHDSAIDAQLAPYLEAALPRQIPDTVPMVLVGFERPAQRIDAMAGLQDIPVLVLQELGLPVPLTFTGNGWGTWGRTVSAQHGAWQTTADGALESWDQGIDQQILTRLSINHPDKLLTP